MILNILAHKNSLPGWSFHVLKFKQQQHWAIGILRNKNKFMKYGDCSRMNQPQKKTIFKTKKIFFKKKAEDINKSVHD